MSTRHTRTDGSDLCVLIATSRLIVISLALLLVSYGCGGDNSVGTGDVSGKEYFPLETGSLWAFESEPFPIWVYGIVVERDTLEVLSEVSPSLPSPVRRGFNLRIAHHMATSDGDLIGMFSDTTRIAVYDDWISVTHQWFLIGNWGGHIDTCEVSFDSKLIPRQPPDYLTWQCMPDSSFPCRHGNYVLESDSASGSLLLGLHPTPIGSFENVFAVTYIQHSFFGNGLTGFAGVTTYFAPQIGPIHMMGTDANGEQCSSWLVAYKAGQ